MAAFIELEWGVAFNTQISHHMGMQKQDFQVSLYMPLSLPLPPPLGFLIIWRTFLFLSVFHFVLGVFVQFLYLVWKACPYSVIQKKQPT
jgi:hypothetical protein